MNDDDDRKSPVNFSISPKKGNMVRSMKNLDISGKKGN